MVLPIAYFPPISWFKALLLEDSLIEQHENYMKQTLRNRCQIATANGVQRLSVPIIKAEKTTDVLIGSGGGSGASSASRSAARNDVRNDGESAFFDYYADDLKPFFLPSQKEATEAFASAGENPTLFSHDLAIIRKFRELMDIDHELRLTDTFIGETYTAFNAEFKRMQNSEPTVGGRRESQCRIQNDSPTNNNAQPNSAFCILHSALNKPYYQVFREKTGFIPDLSILDLLFNLGPESACYLLK